jgi:IclR family pca regulon transcriptional regulator
MTEKYISNALIKGLKVLEAFSISRQVLNQGDIAEVLGVTNSASYRVISTLEQAGYIKKVPGKRGYRLSPRVLDLGFTYLGSLNIVEIAKPHVDALRDETNLSVHLSVLEGHEIVYIYRAHSYLSLITNIAVGTRYISYTTAMGRVLLANKNEQEIRKIFDNFEIEQTSSFKGQTLSGLVQRAVEDRMKPYVIQKSAFFVGEAALAAPIMNKDGSVIAAINLSGPESYFKNEEKLANLILGTANDISTYI